MRKNSVTIYVNNKEYSIRGNVDDAVLRKAVELLNSRIDNYKKKTHRDELRSAVMAGLSVAIDLFDSNREAGELSSRGQEYEKRIRDLINIIDNVNTD
ncbi:MAG: cell division protein ZapA [Fibrobacterota bacterium]